MSERWRGPLLLLVLAWALLAVEWTVVEVAGYVTFGATAADVIDTLFRVGSIAVAIWILRTFRQRRANPT